MQESQGVKVTKNVGHVRHGARATCTTDPVSRQPGAKTGVAPQGRHSLSTPSRTLSSGRWRWRRTPHFQCMVCRRGGYQSRADRVVCCNSQGCVRDTNKSKAEKDKARQSSRGCSSGAQQWARQAARCRAVVVLLFQPGITVPPAGSSAQAREAVVTCDGTQA